MEGCSWPACATAAAVAAPARARAVHAQCPAVAHVFPFPGLQFSVQSSFYSYTSGIYQVRCALPAAQGASHHPAGPHTRCSAASPPTRDPRAPPRLLPPSLLPPPCPQATQCNSSLAVNHAMLLVGYNATAGVGSPDSYWIIRNSWGWVEACVWLYSRASGGGTGWAACCGAARACPACRPASLHAALRHARPAAPAAIPGARADTPTCRWALGASACAVHRPGAARQPRLQRLLLAAGARCMVQTWQPTPAPCAADAGRYPGHGGGWDGSGVLGVGCVCVCVCARERSSRRSTAVGGLQRMVDRSLESAA